MSKELINIDKFDKGLIPSVDPQDIDPNAMSYSENLDANVNGKLQGIPGNSVKSATLGLNYQRGGFLKRANGMYDLIYSDGTNIKAIQDFYGTPSGSTVISSVVGKAFVKQGLHMHIGTGNTSSNTTKWVGYTGTNLFGGISQLAYTGSGLNDAHPLGNYSGAANATFTIKISSLGTPDQWQWKKDSGSYSTAVDISSGVMTLQDGISVLFFATTGHALDDVWTFNVAVPSTAIFGSDALLSTYEGSSAGQFTLTGGGGSSTYLHRWKFSLVYDGISESSLSIGYVDAQVPNKDILTETLTLTLHGAGLSPNSFDKRLTSVNLYCAVSIDTNAANLGESQLVTSIPLTELSINYEQQLYINTGNDIYWLGVKIGSILGITYQQNTGIPETNDVVILNYNLAAIANGYNIVGDCYENSLIDAQFRLFRSKQGQYNNFDIVNDSMYIGFTPLAMEAFNGKLYVWDSSHTYVVDPDGLFIQDIIPGIGCSNDRSCEVIEVDEAHALIWSDVNNVYMSVGSGVMPIGDAIKIKAESGSVAWQSMINSSAIIIYDAVKQLVLIFVSLVANTDTQVFAYHILRKRWDYFPSFAAASTFITGAFTGANGETYAATSANLYNNFGSTTNRAWVYIGSELTFNTVEQIKAFYNFRIDSAGTGTTTPYYSIDKGSNYRTLTNTTEIKDVSGNWERHNSIRLKLTGAVGSCYVNAIELLYRKMMGVR